MKLRYDPYQIFKTRKTPIGLYARQKWLGESDTVQWRGDFHETIGVLISGQSEDGLWNASPHESIRRLFGLHLTQRSIIPEIEKSLDTLMKQILRHKSISSLDTPCDPVSPDAYRELPFVTGQTHVSIVSMVLFLAAVFHKDREPAVLAHYRLISQWVTENATSFDAWPDNSNALRALVVHPYYGKDRSTVVLVDYLAEIQEQSGRWPSQIPFYLTINALAHLHLERAERQWDNALATLYKTQNSDGSWGNKDFEWNTFLVVHALKNKGCL